MRLPLRSCALLAAPTRQTARAVRAHGVGGAGDLLGQRTSLGKAGRVTEDGEGGQVAEGELAEGKLGASHVGAGAAGELQAHAVVRSGEDGPAGGGRDGDEEIVGVVGGFGARTDDRLGGEARVDA